MSLILHVGACCWIDLFATDCIAEILAAVPYRWTVPEYVLREEVLSVASAAGGEERCDFQALIGGGLLAVLPIRTVEEKEAWARFAADLDDGEAAVCALASIHGGVVATNDRKVGKVLSRLQLEIPIVQTPELLFRWVRATRPPRAKVKRALENVMTRARFSPPRNSPYADWRYGRLSR